MNGDEVALYLQAHPEFFDEYEELLAGIELKHPHDGRAIALSERQIIQLRSRNKVLESKLRELLNFGEENDSISERLHQTTTALIRTNSLEELLRLVYLRLQNDFAIPHVAIRLWDRHDRADLSEYEPVGEEVKAFAAGAAYPYCSHQPMLDTAQWFGAAQPALRSFGYVALRNDAHSAGLIALASEDPRRFYPEMGTLYLARLGELVAAALSRHRSSA
jgi:uncharacterized protein